MDADWPAPSARIRDLIRRGAEKLLEPGADWTADLHAATLSGQRMRSVADDPVLIEQVRRGTTANLIRWASANVHNPGQRVAPDITTESLHTTRDLVRRGLDERALDTYRTGQSAAWQRWMRICFELTDEPGELHELLDVSLRSMTAFVNDTVDLVAERVAAERHLITQGSHAERLATVMLVLEGAPIPRARVEAQLGYRLTGTHTAAIIWGVSETTAEHLEAAAEALTRAEGSTRRLTVVASAAALWMWLPTKLEEAGSNLAAVLTRHPELRVAVGRPDNDLEGFRRSHLDAATVQRILARLDSPRQFARYDDVALVALMTTEPAEADRFVTDTLGELAHADPEFRETVAAYIRERFNTSNTALRLHTHRNTVIRRLKRADELLPRPLGDNITGVAAALELLDWRGDRNGW